MESGHSQSSRSINASRRTAMQCIGRMAATSLVFLGASAQSAGGEPPFPTRPVNLIVPFPAGGVMDYIARTIAPKLSAAWGQTVIVDNKPGAFGIVAATAALQAAPDGHTILLGFSGLALNRFLMKSVPYDAQKSFAPISTITWGAAILYVNPNLPAKDLAEFVAYVKARPQQLSYASGGIGTIPHLTAVLLQQKMDIEMTHIPYRGAAPAVNDVMSGQVQAIFDYAVPSGEFVRSGKLRALFVAGPKRNPALPNVPTSAEVGLPGFDSITWSGLFAHASTPPAIVRKISRDITSILASEEEQARGAKLGIEFRGSTPEALKDIIDKDIAQWGEVIKKSDIRLLE